MSGLSGILPELKMGVSSLLAHKLRSLLTMLGMIFGVGAVVAMLSITAGAQKEMMKWHRTDFAAIRSKRMDVAIADRPKIAEFNSQFECC